MTDIHHEDIMLKPCPFCGGNAEEDNCDNGSGKWIQCEDCGAMIKVPYRVVSDDELKAMWNKRVK